MSKIMKAIYAEARAARENAARDAERRRREPEDDLSQQVRQRAIRSWRQRHACVGNMLANQLLICAINSTNHPCIPSDHVNWWSRHL
jgi:hypothetical protein